MMTVQRSLCLLAIVVGICLSSGTHAAEETKEPRVRIKTNLGDIVIALDRARAPVTVANFLSYVDANVYANTIFHRVIPGFMVQGGGFYQDMSGSFSKAPIRNEADNGLRNVRGTIAMARTDLIDSAAGQFFINVRDNASLDHSTASCTREDEEKQRKARAKGLNRPATCSTFGYAVFGRVASGMETVDQIERKVTRSVGSHQNVPIDPVVVLSMERLTTPP